MKVGGKLEKAPKEKRSYYVYQALVDGVVKYVGNGKGNRYKHCNSGMSSCV